MASAAGEETRRRILDATEEILLEEGYAAVSSRSVAAADPSPPHKAEVGAIARDVRRMQMDVLADLLPEYGIDTDLVPPELFAAALQGLAFSAVQDHVAGYDTHAGEAIEAMGRLVDRLERRRSEQARPRSPSG